MGKISGETTLGELREQFLDDNSDFYKKIEVRKYKNDVKQDVGVNCNALDMFMVFVLGGITSAQNSLGLKYSTMFSNADVPGVPWRQQCGQFLYGEVRNIEPEKLKSIRENFDDNTMLKEYVKLKEVLGLDDEKIKSFDKVYNYLISDLKYDVTFGKLREEIKNENSKFSKWANEQVKNFKDYFANKKGSDYEQNKQTNDEFNAFMLLMAIILGGVAIEFSNQDGSPRVSFYTRIKALPELKDTPKDIWHRAVREYLEIPKGSNELTDENNDDNPNKKMRDNFSNSTNTTLLIFEQTLQDKVDTTNILGYNLKDFFNNMNTYSYKADLLVRHCKNLMQNLGIKYKGSTMSKDNEKNVTSIVENAINEFNQVIFTGAPGTGKTYSVRKYVKGFGEDRYEFVQFHPSYDYSDFIEGLRPVNINGSNDPTFVRMDGVFKKFCRKIVEENLMIIYDIKDKDNSKLSYSMLKIIHDLLEYIAKINELIDDIKVNGRDADIDTKINDIKNDLVTKTVLSQVESEKIATRIQELDNKSGDELKKEKREIIVEFITCYGGFDSIKDSNDNQISKVDNVKDRIKNFLFNNYSFANTDKEKFNWYFFVVDEVNRADLSKVFGEIMFGLEESYRGLENRFDTQYMNLDTYEVKDGKAERMKFDCFKKGFFIPRNLKFIGTMNDIDRSVESFDFALRRRFNWVDIKANAVMENSLKSMLGDKASYIIDGIKRMNQNAISGEIGKRLGLSEAYHIGPAYFKEYDESDHKLENIFNNNIESILREYTRGRKSDDINALIKKCREELGLPEDDSDKEV